MNDGPVGPRVRLDRWLWAARLFRTRALATDAVCGGKVQVGGQRAKPARAVHPGEMLAVRRGDELLELEVLALSDRRGPAREAAGLYRETEASRVRREHEREQRRLAAQSAPAPERRPSKQDRRRIVRFIRK